MVARNGSGNVFDRIKAFRLASFKFATVRERGTIAGLTASLGLPTSLSSTRSLELGGSEISSMSVQTIDAETTCGSFFRVEYAHFGVADFVGEGVMVGDRVDVNDAGLVGSSRAVCPLLWGANLSRILEGVLDFGTMSGGGLSVVRPSKRDRFSAGCSGFSEL
jgi:hypothetical protein